MLPRILLAVEKAAQRKRFENIVSELKAIVQKVPGSKALWRQLSRESGDLVLINRTLLLDPLEDTVQLLKDAPESPSVVVITEKEDPQERGLLLASGCDAVLPRQLKDEVIRDVLLTLMDKRREETKLKLNAQFLLAEPRLSDFVSESPAMKSFMEVVERVVHSDTSLLILGETGVGKERLARAVHLESHRSKGPFIAVNCAALPDTLLESELFGHKEGAFTGATRTRRGWFEMGHGGTIFLDEIGEMPLHLQIKLLRVLQEREVTPLGSERTIPIDVRIIAATNRDLEEGANAGEFRRDLFYRLSVVTLTLPPLRDRREDITALAHNYIDYFEENLGRRVDGITEQAMDALVDYPWPGNVRELMNVIERAVLLCRGPKIDLQDLPAAVNGLRSEVQIPVPAVQPSPSDIFSLPDELLKKTLRTVRHEAVAKAETAYLKALLAETKGRVGETAKRAGIEPRSLFEKMKRYGLKKEDFR